MFRLMAKCIDYYLGVFSQILWTSSQFLSEESFLISFEPDQNSNHKIHMLTILYIRF